MINIFVYHAATIVLHLTALIGHVSIAELSHSPIAWG